MFTQPVKEVPGATETSYTAKIKIEFHSACVILLQIYF